MSTKDPSDFYELNNPNFEYNFNSENNIEVNKNSSDFYELNENSFECIINNVPIDYDVGAYLNNYGGNKLNIYFSTYGQIYGLENCDKFIINDSSDDDAPKYIIWSNIKNSLSSLTMYDLSVFRETSLHNLTVTGHSNFVDSYVSSISGATIYSGNTELGNLFSGLFAPISVTNDVTRVQSGTNTYTGGTDNYPTINISGASLHNLSASGSVLFYSMSATTLSGGTIYSGDTELGSIISSMISGFSGGDVTRIQPGLNTYTGGTNNYPTINVSGASLYNAFIISLSGGTIYSGDTELGSLINVHYAPRESITRIQPGLNTYTGGTDTEPTININDVYLNTTYSTALSGGTIYSGDTELGSIISSMISGFSGGDVTRIQPGLNTYTGGTNNYPTINVSGASLHNLSVSGSALFCSLSATTLSGGTIYSGNTELGILLSNVFAPISVINNVTRIQPGLNTYTGGTDNFPTINISAATLNYLSATTISADTLYAHSISGLSPININNTIIESGHITATTIFADGSRLHNLNLNNTFGQIPLSSYTGSFIKNTIIVGKSGSTNYSSITEAINSISDASTSNRYSIIVYPGTYVEDTIILKEYVDIHGLTYNSVIVEVNSSNKDVIVLTGNTTLENLILKGSTDNGKALFRLSSNMGVEKVCTIKDCSAGNTDMIFKSTLGAGEFGIVTFEGILGTYGSYYNNGFYLSGNGYTILSVADTKDSVSHSVNDYIYATGNNNRVILTNVGVLVQPSLGGSMSNFIRCSDGATIQGEAASSDYVTTGIYNEDFGDGCSLALNGFNFLNSTQDINIQNSATTGDFRGYASFEKIYINPLSSFYVSGKDLKTITVANKGGDFSSIAEAVDYITGSSDTNRFEILVGAGEFYEPLIDLSSKPYVSVVGYSIQTTNIYPDADNHHVFKVGSNNELSFLTISNAGAGYAGVASIDGGDFFQLHKISFTDCDTGVKVTSSSQDTYGWLEYVDFNGTMTYGVYIEASNDFDAFVSGENFFTFPSETGSTSIYITGVNSKFIGNACGIYGTVNPGDASLGNTGIECQNGASVTLTSAEISGFDTGLKNNNTGTGCTISIAGSIFTNNDTYDINIQSPYTTGGMIGAASTSKIYVNSSSDFTPAFTDRESGGRFSCVGDLYQGSSVSRLVNLSKLVIAESSMGLYEGGELSVVSGRTISVNTGSGYLFATGEYLKEIEWNTTELTIPSGVTKFIKVNENSVVSADDSKGDGLHSILLGSVYTTANNIHYIEITPLSIHTLGNRTIEFINDAFGVVYISGSIVTENGTRKLDVTGGERYYNLQSYTSTGGTQIFFEEHWRNGDGTYRHGPFTSTTVPNDIYDYGSGFTSVTSSYYTKHSLYVTGEGVNEKYLLVYSQNQYSGLTDAVSADLPTPPSEFLDSTCVIASLIMQEGDANIVQIRDERPVVGFNASTISSTLIHGNLQGLSSDDHTQYLLSSGSRAMEGNLNVGGYNIISAGTINGLSIESHASRHLPNGDDPITTAAPISISNKNEEGVANSFARSDHKHSHDSQSGGSTHDEATTSVGGFMSAADKSYLDYVPTIFNTKANLSGSTFTSISAVTFSSQTIYSGDTEIGNLFSGLFAPISVANDVTRVQPGTNTYTGGTGLLPTVNISGASLYSLSTSGSATFYSASATTLSGQTIYSGDTELGNLLSGLFAPITVTNDVTRVQPGTNTYTGGTDLLPTVNISGASLYDLSASGSVLFHSMSATSLSGHTIYSGNTELGNLLSGLFAPITVTNDVTRVQPGVNTYTGGTGLLPTVNISGASLYDLSASGSVLFYSMSATSLSGQTIYSGDTELGSLFISLISRATSGGTGGDTTRVQPGTNTYTGGTGNFPTVNISAATLDNVSVSGNSIFSTISATTEMYFQNKTISELIHEIISSSTTSSNSYFPSGW